MTAHTKRKLERLAWKRHAQHGRIPHPSTGAWVIPRDLPLGENTSVHHFQAGHRIGR